MAHLYFAEDLEDERFAPGTVLDVTGEEARHAVRVSRLRVDEEILVGNGRGTVGTGRVLATARDRFTVELGSVRVEDARSPRLVLVQALAKGDRDTRTVEQATEFGIDVIIPWEAPRSVAKWGSEKSERGVAKWQRIAREAAKQSLRARIPEVRQAVNTSGVCALTAHSEVLVLHPEATTRMSACANDPAVTGAAEITFVVGPEGGLGPGELEELAASGARVVGLGPEVLRTSSAGPAAIAVFNAAIGRW